MGDPAVIWPTTRHGIIERIAKHLLSSVVIALFLLIGTASAGAVELVDDVVEVLPGGEANEGLPVDEVVAVLPRPAPEPEPDPDPVPATNAPAAPEPDADPEPAIFPPGTPQPATRDAPDTRTQPPPEGSVTPVVDAVSGLDLPDPVTGSVSEAPLAVNDPSPLPTSDSQAPPVPMPGAGEYVVGPPAADGPAAPLHLAPTLDGVQSALGSIQETPVLESLPSLGEVVSGADQLVVGPVEDLLEPVGSLIAPSLSVLDDVLESASDLLAGTVSALAGTVDTLVPNPVPVSSAPIVTPIVVLPGEDPPPAPDPSDERRTGSGIPPPPQVGKIEPVVTTEPVETTSAKAGLIARPAASGLVDEVLTVDLLTTTSEGAPTTRSRHDTQEAGNWVRNSDLTRSPLPNSTSSQVFAFVAVLALLGLVAPRLCCWLRLQPDLWRPNALALAIERPG